MKYANGEIVYVRYYGEWTRAEVLHRGGSDMGQTYTIRVPADGGSASEVFNDIRGQILRSEAEHTAHLLTQ